MTVRQVGRRVGFGAVVAGVVMAVALAGWEGVQACGPDWEPDVFVNKSAPDNVAAFAKGELGLLEEGLDSNDYAVAYRYLNGGRLSADEQRAYAPAVPRTQDWSKLTPEELAAAQEAQREARRAGNAPTQWLQARAQFVPGADPKAGLPGLPTDQDGVVQFASDTIHCPDAAFRTAVATLRSRAQTWSSGSATLADWIHGQDAVFANCRHGMPAIQIWANGAGKEVPPPPTTLPDAAASGTPELLRQDRAYQTAAANFYAENYDDAARAFAAIAHDSHSPWSAWGEYLAARALVRKAFAMGKPTDPYSTDLATFDRATMQQAQRALEKLLAERDPKPSREAVQLELNFVRIRTEPAKRMVEICAALAGPGPDANYANDLADLNFALVKGIQPAPQPPLLDWIHDWRGKDKQDALAYWERTHGVPWLVLALYQADAKDAAAPELMAEAEKVTVTSPAYDTVFFQRVRLLEGMKRGDEARTLLNARLPEVIRRGPSSNQNALLGQRMTLARSVDEFLEYAPRVEMSGMGDWFPDKPRKTSWPCPPQALWMQTLGHCPTDDHPAQFDEDAIGVLNRHAPLRLWLEAAKSDRLPPNLRQDVALAGWTRSVALEDAAHAAEFASLLPAPLRDVHGVGLAAEVAILKNPGLRPYLESGTTRLEAIAELDPFRDNWWSSQWAGRFASASPQLDAPDPAQFLSAADLRDGEAETQRLTATKDGVVLLGQRILDCARAHPEDAGVPEALALTVRATRYGASAYDDKDSGAQMSAVSKAAFELLHHRYPKSPWTAKTKYYY